MIVGDPAGDGCRGCKERVGGEREDDRLWSRGGRRRKVEAPELSRGKAGAGEDDVTVWEMEMLELEKVAVQPWSQRTPTEMREPEARVGKMCAWRAERGRPGMASSACGWR
jgi:hypothetical protein